MSKRSFTLAEISEKLADIVAAEINTYEKELVVKADEIVKEVANDFANDLRPNVPVGKGDKDGHLRDHLNVKEITRKGKKIQSVNFGKKYRLVHLTEYGHYKVDGAFMRRTPYIRPTFERNAEKYTNKIKEDIERQLSGNV